MRLICSLICLGLCLLGDAQAASDLPTVGISPRGSTVVNEGDRHARLSFYYTNDKLTYGSWRDRAQWQNMVRIKIEATGTANIRKDFRRTAIFRRNLRSGLHTTFPRWWKTLWVKNDRRVEGDETLTITILPDPSYNIDPDNASVTFTIIDDDGSNG